MAFNHKLADIIVAGQYNGALSFFDLRRGHSSGVIKPTDTTGWKNLTMTPSTAPPGSLPRSRALSACLLRMTAASFGGT
jgi:hypothetical protein